MKLSMFFHDADSLSLGDGWGEAKHKIYLAKRSMTINPERTEGFDKNLNTL